MKGKNMKIRKIIAGLGLTAGIAAAAGFWWVHQDPALSVGSIVFGQHRSELQFHGTVEIQEVHLGSKIGGRVAEVCIREGDLVEAGQILLRFEEPELETQLIQQRARLAQKEAELEKAVNGSRPEEIAEARAQLGIQEANLDLARNNLQRGEWLAPRGGLSKEDLDQRRQAAAAAEANVNYARHALRLAELGPRREDIELARSNRDEARGKLREVEANLAEGSLRAPEPAVVQVLAVRKGDVVLPNQVVVRVLRADDLWVKVFVPETQVCRVHLGSQAAVSIDGYPGKQFAGTVEQIAAESEYTPRNVQSADERRHQVFAVKVRVADPDGIFKSGMAADVTFPEGSK
jgi:multidrug resistance efflux pump